MSVSTEGISFLYGFDFGNRDYLAPGSKILSVTSQAAGDFDKANLTTESLRHVWRSADVNDWQEIIVEADIVSKIDTVGILGHNFSESVVVQVQADNSTLFVAPPVSFSVPYSEGNMVLCMNFGASYRYYKIRILDPLNPCGYVEVGRVIGGRAFTFTNNEDINDDIDVSTMDFADSAKTEGFFQVSNERVKADSLRVSFAKLITVPPENTNYLGFKRMIKIVGKTKPFLTIVDRADPGFVSIWGQMTTVPGFQYVINRYATTSMTVEEMF